jgi:hypothetical protein
MNARIRGTAIGAALAAACLTVATPARAADVTTSPGKASVFETRRYADRSINFSSAEGQILKAKPKNVVTITASAYTHLPLTNAQRLLMYAYVNASQVETGFTTSCPSGSDACSVTGTWIVDLDAAEAAAPGTVMGKPVDVWVSLFDANGNDADQIQITMAARMEKKR